MEIAIMSSELCSWLTFAVSTDLKYVEVNVDNLAGLKDFFFHSDSACELGGKYNPKGGRYA